MLEKLHDDRGGGGSLLRSGAGNLGGATIHTSGTASPEGRSSTAKLEYQRGQARRQIMLAAALAKYYHYLGSTSSCGRAWQYDVNMFDVVDHARCVFTCVCFCFVLFLLCMNSEMKTSGTYIHF